MRNFVRYASQAQKYRKRVFFLGTGALVKGQGVCYSRGQTAAAANTAATAATDADERRDNMVNLPSSSNNDSFAGVTIQAYSANAAGQWIDIYEPGSVCEIAVHLAATVNSTVVTCSAASGNAGYFHNAGFMGRGTALCLQTRGALSDTTTTPGVLASSLVGSATVSTTPWKTISSTGLFANAAAGDFVFVVGGGTTATMVTPVTVGKYTIDSVTNDNTAVMTSAIATVDSSVAAYVVRGSPTVLAYLYDGEDSRLTEWITPDSATAVSSMVGGVTFIFGGSGVDITTDSTYTLADGLYTGMMKRWRLMGALGTNDYLVTLGTTGEQLDGTTDLASLEFDGANDDSLLIWGGQYWRLLVNKGTGLAS